MLLFIPKEIQAIGRQFMKSRGQMNTSKKNTMPKKQNSVELVVIAFLAALFLVLGSPIFSEMFWK